MIPPQLHGSSRTFLALPRHPLSVLHPTLPHVSQTWTFLLSSNGTERGHPAFQPRVYEGVAHSESDVLFGIDPRRRTKDEWSPLQGQAPCYSDLFQSRPRFGRIDSKSRPSCEVMSARFPLFALGHIVIVGRRETQCVDLPSSYDRSPGPPRKLYCHSSRETDIN